VNRWIFVAEGGAVAYLRAPASPFGIGYLAHLYCTFVSSAFLGIVGSLLLCSYLHSAAPPRCPLYAMHYLVSAGEL
jgi:hypothetical protein